MEKFDYLTDDLAFKQVFMHKEILEDLITAFFEYVGKDNNGKIITELIPNAYLSGDNKKYRSYYGDLTATKEDGIISIEMYKDTFNKDSYNKSLGYLCRLYSKQEKRIQPSKYKKVTSINFIKGNYKRINNEVVNGYSFKGIISNEEINDNIVMYLVRYDLVEEIPYKKDEERFIRYLRIIGSRSVKEMKKYARGDKVMEETIKWLREWNIESDRINYQRRIEEAEEKGEERGSTKRNIDIAKELLKDGTLPIEKIMSITKLSEKEINKILRKLK